MNWHGTHDLEGRILGLQGEGEQLITRLAVKGVLTSELATRIRNLCNPESSEPLAARFAELEQIVISHQVEPGGLARWFR